MDNFEVNPHAPTYQGFTLLPARTEEIERLAEQIILQDVEHGGVQPGCPVTQAREAFRLAEAFINERDERRKEAASG